MWSVRTLPEFDEWLDSVRDAIWEMREHFGPGWRMYYTRRGGQVVLMLGGGDKSTQRQDIAAAKARALRIL
ncbi:MAG: type II toxin-antitoxin system RelE/ParE family toxin [Gammaproteobacteria bacterium]|jgi:putative addiction module killer protein